VSPGLHRHTALLLASAAAIALAVVAVMSFASESASNSARPGASSIARSPAVLPARARATRRFEYVVNDHKIWVYDIDHHNRLVETINVPQVVNSHGIVASPVTGRLYVSYGGEGGSAGNGSMLAYDLRRNRVIWVRHYATGIDSMAITPNGRTIYMPQGEAPGNTSRSWSVINAATGAVTGAIRAGLRPHNTIMSLDGKFVYLGAVASPYLDVASTARNRVVKQIGPLHGPGAGRPFTINGSQTLAFNTATSFLGFQVSSIRTGKVLYTVAPSGFTWNSRTFGGGGRTPDHGISLSPDEHELYLIDAPNGYVHVFDVSGLPAAPPRDVANIKLAHPPPVDGWLQHSRDGRYVYVGLAGDVIDTKTRKIVAFLPALQRTADFLEIDWRAGRPVSSTSRYGTGYVVARPATRR
jgi:DNA-binding beta-propeller fold protein YncE